MLWKSIKAYIGGELDLPQVQEELDIIATQENCYSESMETPGQFFLLLKASHERKDIAWKAQNR